MFTFGLMVSCYDVEIRNYIANSLDLLPLVKTENNIIEDEKRIFSDLG